ncbi:hypothetical protein [Reinekea blandensis]|uniref:Uncharacterized protein n=1 Tax=Reinekea blandensis MED297 TaxID=314283 RepID=A4BA96_9GAMM|nr:hypothetical protein [Reinekea blandensis]EAR10852.1 hypothetical protein MED297_10091 [Reinekea sp. MED297] [Reinekea blandensis MED297]
MQTFSLSIWSGLVLTALTPLSQALEADWLYLSNNGTWVSRTASLLNEKTQLQLPVEQLQAHQFWWQSDVADLRLVWSQPDPLGLPGKGDPVEIQGEAGLWLVKDVSASHLVLQQGRNVRYWPQSQWHLLKWTSTAELGLSLTVEQSQNTKGDLFYAWQTPDLSADVHYRLQEIDGESTLVQELVVTNHSDNDYEAAGYSYAQTATQGPMMLSRSVSMESDAMVSAPKAGQSQGVPTLMSDEPVMLSANANVWLPVSSTELTDVERQYQLNWDSRQQGLQRAQSNLVIRSDEALPDLSGPVKVGVFDGQIALLESQYQPAEKNEARISLGQSALVTMTSRQTREGHWTLAFSNRTDEVAVVELTVSHWNGQSSQRIPMTVRIDAQDEKDVELELGGGGLIQIGK